jgi:hypothetical protein
LCLPSLAFRLIRGKQHAGWVKLTLSWCFQFDNRGITLNKETVRHCQTCSFLWFDNSYFSIIPENISQLNLNDHDVIMDAMKKLKTSHLKTLRISACPGQSLLCVNPGGSLMP